MMEKETSIKLEWRINVPDGTQKKLIPESGVIQRVWVGLKSLLRESVLKLWRFFEKAWNIGVAEPKKVIHGLKVGVALTILSLLYYIRPLYEGVGGNGMWAVMTVVVVFEYTVGATLNKCINRTIATLLAGSLGVGVHWIASHSGDQFEPIILGISVFLLASAATFSRFVPSVKARFDYGALIFILTFSLVSVSGYRVEKLFDLAHHRLSTIAIGTSLCILISVVFCPVWAGNELHSLVHRNLEKLADSLDGCVAGYFTGNSDVDSSKKMEGYKCVINSKTTEDSMANFARWEPAHGRFNFQHPWKQYLSVGASLRSCAYCIQTLNGCMNSEIQAPEHLKKHVGGACLTFTSHASSVLKELAYIVTTMRKSPKIDFTVKEMQFAAEQLQNTVKSLPNHHLTSNLSPIVGPDPKSEVITKATMLPLIEVLPLVTVVSLLLETAARIKEIIDTVNELATLANFKPANTEKPNHDHPYNELASTNRDH